MLKTFHQTYLIGLFALTAVLPVGTSAEPAEELPAFPGAEGFGSKTPGGRGGDVLFVTNLKDSGPGSLRAAVEAEGPRIIVFRSAGLIDLESPLKIREPFVTIAAQTAPGDGIALRNWPVYVETHDVIIRGLRVRTGDRPGPRPDNSDALAMANQEGGVYNIILDHCSFSWAIDENLSTWHACHDITVQWCVISEALHDSRHSKGPHSMGFLIGNHARNVSFHHNLMVSNHARNPRPKGDTSSEIINNLIVNWGWAAINFADVESSGPSQSHIIGNTFIAGPDTKEGRCIHFSSQMPLGTCAYSKDNVHPGIPFASSGDGSPHRHLRHEPLFASSGISVDDATVAKERVLAHAGASIPQRDPVDTRVVKGVLDGTAKIIDSQSEVGGWPEYVSAEPPADRDRDGMPDAWEVQHALDPDHPDDDGDADGDGYTNIEEYINGLFEIELKHCPVTKGME